MERIKGLSQLLLDFVSCVIWSTSDGELGGSSGLQHMCDVITQVREQIKSLVRLDGTSQRFLLQFLPSSIKMLRSLHALTLDSPKRHQDMRAKRYDGSGRWLLQHHRFLRWADKRDPDASNTMCCYGMPGAGKTILRCVDLI